MLKSCEYNKVGVVIENENKEILTGFNGRWLSDICFYPNNDGIKERVINNEIEKDPNFAEQIELIEKILNLQSEQLDEKYLRDFDEISKEASKIIRDYLKSLDDEEIKELCRTCYLNSDDENIQASREQLGYNENNVAEIDNLLECKKNHIDNIIHYIKKTKGFDFKLDIIKGTVEECDSNLKISMIRELSEEVRFKYKHFANSSETFLSNDEVFKKLIKIKNEELFQDFFEFEYKDSKVKIFRTTTEKLAQIGLYPVVDEISEINYKSELYRIKFRSFKEIKNPNYVVKQVLKNLGYDISIFDKKKSKQRFSKMGSNREQRFSKMGSNRGQRFSKMGSNRGQGSAKKSSDEGMWKRMDRKVSAKKSSDEGMWKRMDRKVSAKKEFR